MSSSNIQFIKAGHSRTFGEINMEWLWFKNHIEKDWNLFVLKSLPLLIIQFGEIGENPRKKSMKVSCCSCTSYINPSTWSSTYSKQTAFYLPPQSHLAEIYIPTDEDETAYLRRCSFCDSPVTTLEDLCEDEFHHFHDCWSRSERLIISRSHKTVLWDVYWHLSNCEFYKEYSVTILPCHFRFGGNLLPSHTNYVLSFLTSYHA